MGAISAVFLSLLQSGDHVLFVNNIYGPTSQLLKHLEKFNIEHDVVDHNMKNVESAIKDNTKIIYVESPGTMLMKFVDLKALATLAKSRGIITAIDNTWATPLYQKPIELGIDLSIHSLTKYLGGHSDVVGGAVIGSHELIDTIFEYGHQLNGSVLGPFDAYLILRGLRTLPVRMAQHQANVSKVIEYLKQQEDVTAIHHPYVESGEMQTIVNSQMLGYSGLLSFELRQAHFEGVSKFIDALRLFKIGVSWGGFESLVNSPIKNDNEAQLKEQGIPLGLIRLSIGLEGAEAQIADLDQAFRKIKA
ncbi:cystathionine beta-lyase/cystathionine gamma-synthase [Pullulanibacillus pueri]|nr:cystathionine beta-lyase/cystathionine gamma-synthase [Pullulanibacillus pueri]